MHGLRRLNASQLHSKCLCEHLVTNFRLPLMLGINCSFKYVKVVENKIKLQFIGLPFYLEHRQSASILATSSAYREIGCPVLHLCPMGRVQSILKELLKPENIETKR